MQFVIFYGIYRLTREINRAYMPNQLFNYRFDDVKGNSFCYTYTSFSEEGIGEMQVKLIGDISSKKNTIQECKNFVQMLGMEFSEHHGKNEYSFSIKTKR